MSTSPTGSTDEADQTMRQFRIGQTTSGGPPEHDSGVSVEFPLVETLRGRMFICGKSGSGKSNSASVLIEKILDAGRPLLIIDVEGEYYGLKESYEVLHAGADDVCDIQVGPEHGEKLAQLSIEQGVPIILDLSGFLDEDEADDLVGAVARSLFATAKQAREPFPVFVEECHEFLPQTGSAGETGKSLVRISKRGRKHGLGLVGISQRPASVDKDFITQCNILVWHRLTWKNDTKVVGNVLGKTYEEGIDTLGDGEAFMSIDPDVIENTTDLSNDILRVQFDRKQTYDAGEAPGLGNETRPELQSVDQGLVDELQSISDRERERQDEIQRLRSKLESRNGQIEELEEELADTKDIRGIMDDMIGSIANQHDPENGGSPVEDGQPVEVTVEGTEIEVPEVLQTEVMEIRQDRREAEKEAEALQDATEHHRLAAEHLSTSLKNRPLTEEMESLRQFVAEFGELTTRHDDIVSEYADVSMTGDTDSRVNRLRERATAAEEQVEELEDKLDTARSVTGREDSGSSLSSFGDSDVMDLLNHESIRMAIDTAAEKGSPAEEHYNAVLSVLVSGGEGQYRSASAVATPLEVSDATVREVLKGLHTANVVTRESQGRGHAYALDLDLLQQRIEVAERQAAIGNSSE